MKLNRVLVVYKKHIGGSGRGGRSGGGKHAPWQRRHDDARDEVLRTLSSLQINCRLIDRRNLKPGQRADLIVTLGGDGTVLAAAHAAGRVPILGVNTMPGRSVGFFCAVTSESLERKLLKITSGKLKAVELPLIEAAIDGRAVGVPALNDVLYAGSSAAEMMRYRIQIDGKSERQRSSGLWISAGPGSTAANLAAG
ncbi:MAG TPA: NAD(+)/NADH kinase, partial [bacterium]|nr:NAD(+)/NADH kinase [bacterium]